MAAPYVLARTFAEAHAYAHEELGLGKGQYRVVNSVGTLKAVRGVDLHLVPGWRNRFDRFAMQSAIRWTRMNVIDGPQEQAQAPETDGLVPAGVQLTLVGDDEASAFFASPETSKAPAADEGIAEEEQAQEPAPLAPVAAEAEPEEPKEAPKAKRRRRCKECGELVDPDSVDEHAAEHASEGV